VIDTTKNFMKKLDEAEEHKTVLRPNNNLNKLYKIRGKTEFLTDNIYDDEKELLKEFQIAKNNVKSCVYSHTTKAEII
jgi:hypothetical protein